MTPSGEYPRRYVALLRAVNVGGTTIKMAPLRETVQQLGCTEVRSYLASGNVLLTTALDETDLRAALEQAIRDRHGITTTVMVRTAQELADVVAARPYPDAENTQAHVGFLHEPPSTDEVRRLSHLDCAPEELTIRGRELYYHLPNGMGRSVLPGQVTKVFKAPMTVRNWRTVANLAGLATG